MGVALPLDQMSVEDKLRALEAIWADLSRAPENIEPPAWHAEVLRARETRVREGSSGFVDWDEAKKRIRDTVG